MVLSATLQKLTTVLLGSNPQEVKNHEVDVVWGLIVKSWAQKSEDKFPVLRLIQPLHAGEQISLVSCILPTRDKPDWVRWLNRMESHCVARATQNSGWRPWHILIPLYKMYKITPTAADAAEFIN